MTGFDASHPGPTEPPAPPRTPREAAPAPAMPDPYAPGPAKAGAEPPRPFTARDSAVGAESPYSLTIPVSPAGAEPLPQVASPTSPHAVVSRDSVFDPPPPRPLTTRDPAPGRPPHDATTRWPANTPPPRPSTARQTVAPMAALQSLRRPGAVTAAVWCWVVGSLLVAVPVLLASTKVDAMRAEFARLAAESDPAAAEATVDRVAGVSVLIVVGTGAVLGLLGLLLAGPLRAGRNWARLLLTLVAVVAVVYTAFVTTAVTDVMLDGLRPVVDAGLLAYLAAVLAATACMFLPAARPWFHRPK